jgi:hypothetical protein
MLPLLFFTSSSLHCSFIFFLAIAFFVLAAVCEMTDWPHCSVDFVQAAPFLDAIDCHGCTVVWNDAYDGLSVLSHMMSVLAVLSLLR